MLGAGLPYREPRVFVAQHLLFCSGLWGIPLLTSGAGAQMDRTLGHYDDNQVDHLYLSTHRQNTHEMK